MAFSQAPRFESAPSKQSPLKPRVAATAAKRSSSEGGLGGGQAPEKKQKVEVEAELLRQVTLLNERMSAEGPPKDVEVAAVRTWTSSCGYTALQKYRRGEDMVITSPLLLPDAWRPWAQGVYHNEREFAVDLDRHLAAGLRKLENVAGKQRLFRGLHTVPPGTQYIENGYFATSRSQPLKAPILMVIPPAMQKARGVAIKDFSAFENEDEVLFPPPIRVKTTESYTKESRLQSLLEKASQSAIPSLRIKGDQCRSWSQLSALVAPKNFDAEHIQQILIVDLEWRGGSD